MSPRTRNVFAKSERLLLAGALLLVALAAVAGATSKRTVKCQGESECSMRAEHFKLYSSVKRALEQNFTLKGKDLVPLIRSVEVLQRRFAANRDGLSARPNGTQLVVSLLEGPKLRAAMAAFTSPEGRQLVDLYKTSINGHHQNLACSRWRVHEIEFAASRLEADERLAGVFANIHRNFLERSARKCLKSSCGSLGDNMGRLDSVLRQPGKRRGFLARDDALQANKVPGEPTNAIDEAQLIAELDNEPAGEFEREELELCRFFKRSGGSRNSSCQASGNELSEISFSGRAHQVAAESARANLTQYLEAYRLALPLAAGASSAPSLGQAANLILAQCHAIKPTLEYHLFGLRWFQRQGLIAADKLAARALWCPSLSYWLEIDRLCGELESSLGAAQDSAGGDKNNNTTFAY